MTNFNEGDIVVRALTGGGFTTEGLVEIDHIDEHGDIFIEGADGDYEHDSVYRFSGKTLKSVNNYTQGFYSTILRKATDDDLENLE